MKLGRPLKGTEKRERVTFTLHPADIVWLKKLSSEKKKTKSEMLSNIIYFFQQKHALELSSEQDPEVILQENLAIPFAQILEVCRKHHVKSLKIFGSVLSRSFRSNSDVDMLIEFQESFVPDLFELTKLQSDFSKMIGRDVDLRTEEEISPLFRNKIKKEGLFIYEQ